jgi:uncharacterized protein (DUF1330 family)
MSAYLVVDLDMPASPAPEQDAYRLQSLQVLAKYGGRAIVQMGQVQVLEGDWTPKGILVLEFPDMAALKGWWDSPEYEPLKAARRQMSTAQVIAVEGL